MEQKLFLIIIALLLSCCRNESHKKSFNYDSDVTEYFQHPSKNDSSCIKDVERAKRDFEKGEIYFCMPFGFGSHELRYERQLNQLCEKYNINFTYEVLSDLVLEDQTQGCYQDFMDKIISDKFGVGFKYRLIEQADSMLAKSNDTIPYYLCDKRPYLKGFDKYESAFTVKISSNLRKQIKPDNDGKLPLMDIHFYIDTLGNPSGYHLSFYSARKDSNNSKFEDQLWKVAMKQLKKHNRWEPGEINGQKIISRNNVRVSFE